MSVDPNLIKVLVELIIEIAWPLTVIGGFFLFRREIRQTIPRISRAGKDGVEFSALSQETSEISSSNRLEVLSAQVAELADPVQLTFEAKLEADLQRVPEGERVKRLQQQVAIEQRARQFYLIYSNIFGSQIRLLRELNTHKYSVELMRSWYDDVQSNHQDLQKIKLDDYLNYLLSWELIEKSGDEFQISARGESFLRFLLEYGVSDRRIN